MQQRLILFLIDVEPDARQPNAGCNSWHGTQVALRDLHEFRSRAAESTGRPVQLNWFLRMDPQIRMAFGSADYVTTACPDLIDALYANGDYPGIHPHLWRWSESKSFWFNDFGNFDWLTECFESSFETFRSIFGYAPEACRFGDRWLNQAAVDLISAKGIRYDLTIEPGLPAEALHDHSNGTEWLPDYRLAPRQPYQPHTTNFLQPSLAASTVNPLWMIPLTTSQPFWGLQRHWPFVQRLSRTPNLITPPHLLWPWLSARLERSETHPLVIALRSGDLVNDEFRRNFLLTTERLLNHPCLPECIFTNPSQVIARIRQSKSLAAAAG